ncbi:hypothetical protein Nepgr_005231 [Nepenthes gracilis]|uniref:Uncharacterized protein n=1 Tax=Nepenthes gracilis TaxID=150966 RepID=A0AAD3S380_NEPGR|nr:hypothetical protein Nepgr_005231 [Nepenthes gracilis]
MKWYQPAIFTTTSCISINNVHTHQQTDQQQCITLEHPRQRDPRLLHPDAIQRNSKTSTTSNPKTAAASIEKSCKGWHWELEIESPTPDVSAQGDSVMNPYIPPQDATNPVRSASPSPPLPADVVYQLDEPYSKDDGICALNMDRPSPRDVMVSHDQSCTEMTDFLSPVSAGSGMVPQVPLPDALPGANGAEVDRLEAHDGADAPLHVYQVPMHSQLGIVDAPESPVQPEAKLNPVDDGDLDRTPSSIKRICKKYALEHLTSSIERSLKWGCACGFLMPFLALYFAKAEVYSMEDRELQSLNAVNADLVPADARVMLLLSYL